MLISRLGVPSQTRVLDSRSYFFHDGFHIGGRAGGLVMDLRYRHRRLLRRFFLEKRPMGAPLTLEYLSMAARS